MSSDDVMLAGLTDKKAGAEGQYQAAVGQEDHAALHTTGETLCAKRQKRNTFLKVVFNVINS